MKSFDCIVIGVGGMGSAALYHLARRGVKVLGLEQFEIAHDRGSSHGRTRIIRKSYFEHPDYVPLLHRAYDLWASLERESGHRLFERTGLLLAGPPQGTVITGVRRTARLHNLDIRDVSPAEMRRRFPGFRPADDMAVLFEPDAGYLKVEECVRTCAEQAISLGATMSTIEQVLDWTAGAGGVEVRTAAQTYRAAKLVICGGAWSAGLLRELGLPLEVRRKVMLWYRAEAPYHLSDGCPAFCFDTADGFFYGFPVIDERGMKVAEHTGGKTVAAPEKLDRTIHALDRTRVERFISTFLPGVSTALLDTSVCMYTMTPDEHFIIDRHPQHENVVYATGFSGHGFKLAPIVGSVLADLVLEGHTREPIEFLSASRPATGHGGSARPQAPDVEQTADEQIP